MYLRRALSVALLAPGCRWHFDPIEQSTDGAVADTSNANVVVLGDRTGMSSDQPVDTFLYEASVGSLGGEPALAIESVPGQRAHPLLRFDLAAVAPGTPVTSARLQLEAGDSGDIRGGTVEARLVTESWLEGGATWTEREPGMAWSTVGGSATTVLATVAGPASFGPIEFALDVAIVQDWIDGTTPNFGLLLVPVGDAHYHFLSDEVVELPLRPQLTLELGH